jgi:hypothetical protein
MWGQVVDQNHALQAGRLRIQFRCYHWDFSWAQSIQLTHYYVIRRFPLLFTYFSLQTWFSECVVSCVNVIIIIIVFMMKVQTVTPYRVTLQVCIHF